jgi:hypothetical protein
MNRKKASILLAMSASAVVLSAQSFADTGELPKHREALSAPRTFEQFPELLRAPAMRERPVVDAASRTERIAKLTENRALAASPRFKEEHPEVLQLEQGTITVRVEEWVEPTSNRALLASPRYLEEHPEILRSTPMLQVAPLK